jgi:membrane protease YdiL (CAAX protease family)
MLAMLFFGVSAWAQALWRWWQGQPLLPIEPRRLAPWSWIDLFAVVAAFIVAQALAVLAVRYFLGNQPIELEDATPDQLFVLVTSQGVANLMTGVLALLAVVARTGASSHDFGIVARELRRDVSIGVAAFFLLALPVFAVQAILTQWFPSEHPLIVLLRDNPDARLYAASAVIAVIVAPVVEELIFRVLLQGWLEKVARTRTAAAAHSNHDLADEIVVAEVVDKQSNLASPGQLESSTLITLEGRLTEKRDMGTSFEETPITVPPLWPVFVSAAVFALMHLGHGPDPIPLFLLAIGLGYLYRQTHRIVPSMTVHFLLNGLSMAALWMEIRYGGA